MRIGQMQAYIVKQYFSPRRKDRRYGLLFIGPPGVGKSVSVETAGREIARKLRKEFLKVVIRWSPSRRRFILNTEGEHEIDYVLANTEKYFAFTDFRLSTIEPSDLSGTPRGGRSLIPPPGKSRDGITYYDPLLWAVIHSATDGILFLDELTWITREDVWSVTPQLVLDKLAGLTKFSENTLVVAAGNRPEDSTLVRLLQAPLSNRFKMIRIEAPTVDEWARWMMETYNDQWDKRTYAFLMRFRDEGYLLKLPEKPEGLEAWPSPRTWTWLALDLYEGFNSLEDIIGLVGEEVGRKFDAFLKLEFDLEDLLEEPAKFHNLQFDAKYIVPVMLANYLNEKNYHEAFPLVDEMCKERHEFIIMTCMCMPKTKVASFLRSLFKYNEQYSKILLDIARDIKNEIAA